MKALNDPTAVPHPAEPGASPASMRGWIPRVLLVMLSAALFVGPVASQTRLKEDRAAAKKKAPPRALEIPAPPRHAPHEPQAPVAVVKPPLPVPPPDTSSPPPRLPPASREKMHACAVQWAKLRLEAQAPPPMWRDFAGKCLTR